MKAKKEDTIKLTQEQKHAYIQFVKTMLPNHDELMVQFIDKRIAEATHTICSKLEQEVAKLNSAMLVKFNLLLDLEQTSLNFLKNIIVRISALDDKLSITGKDLEDPADDKWEDEVTPEPVKRPKLGLFRKTPKRSSSKRRVDHPVEDDIINYLNNVGAQDIGLTVNGVKEQFKVLKHIASYYLNRLVKDGFLIRQKESGRKEGRFFLKNR